MNRLGEDGVCRVAVGSENPVKVNAVRRAFKLYCTARVEGVRVESGVPSQPLGFNEIVEGAFNRACSALNKAQADYGVGVEAGLLDTGIEYIELQVAVIVDRARRATIGFSQGFPLPVKWLDELKRRVELGEIASRETGRSDIGEKLGLIGYLTQGLVTRTDLTYNAVLMALVPRLNPELYSSLPRVDELRARLRWTCE